MKEKGLGSRLAVMICEACQKIFRGTIVFLENSEPVSKLHHQTEDDLLRAVKGHCRICTLIWREISKLDSSNVRPSQRYPTRSVISSYQLLEIVDKQKVSLLRGELCPSKRLSHPSEARGQN